MGCCGTATRIQTARAHAHDKSLDDQDFHGPLQDRVCRDVVFLIIFIAFCVFGIGLLGYAGSKSDVDRLLRGTDEVGNVCGRANKKFGEVPNSGKDYSHKPFVEVDFNGIEPVGTCVQKCGANMTTLGWYCIIDIEDNEFYGSDILQNIGQTLRMGWPQILIAGAIALALSIIITVLLRFLAAVIVWVSVVIIIVGSIAATIYLWVTWYMGKTKLDNNGTSMTETKRGNMEKQVNLMLVYAIIATIVTVLILVVLIAMRKRIKLVIALFKEAGKVVAAMPLLIIQPFWTFLALALVTVAWLGASLVILSAGQPKVVDNYVDFERDSFIKSMSWYHLFAILWLVQFVIACQHVAIAGGVAQWYFTRDKRELGWPIMTSVKRLLRYHLGSVAFGSFLIALVQLIRILLKRVEKTMSVRSGCGWLVKCCQCCLWIFEKFLKFLNRHAYIEIAIYGYGFCKAAQSAFGILSRNALRVAAINSVGTFVLFLAKVAIIIPTVFIGLEVAKGFEKVTLPWVLIVFEVAISYMIAHCFISVYEMTIDTLFLCFCEDCERNDGITKPYFMSQSLMKFVENNEKAQEALKARKQSQITYVDSAVTQKTSHGHGGMTPLRPAYPPHSIPPSPRSFMPPLA